VSKRPAYSNTDKETVILECWIWVLGVSDAANGYVDPEECLYLVFTMNHTRTRNQLTC